MMKSVIISFVIGVCLAKKYNSLLSFDGGGVKGIISATCID